ncbi:FAD-dependent monooxygenase [Phyllobacterium sophorae]|uniref:FAD-dependent monooxygenase n=1 Tax=Phyllobacterium sophorae TaxID=1520277 RepID=UPI002477DF77|nr:FAD-dependent monooxygenase [Phyllobacterium sophorae]
MFQHAVGLSVEAEIISRGTWTAGYALVAESYGRGRILLGGDAVHLFTPAGGLGYNTAVDDAVNLGWKLAAALKGVAAPAILETYEHERRPIAVRNTGFARQFAESIGLYKPQPCLEDDTAEGQAIRKEAGAYLASHGKAEFNIPGTTFGARYDGSPVIFSEQTVQVEDLPNAYAPTAAPGGRAPHFWIDSSTSLYDLFGFEWTLLRLGKTPPSVDHFILAAAQLGMELTIVNCTLPEVQQLYEAPLALIRPDQIVAWRGSNDADARRVIETVLGHQMPRLEKIAS